MTQIKPSPVRLTTADGAALSGLLFARQAPSRRAIVLHPATGVPQTFYAAFAAWAAEAHEAAVLTYDYRDFGASRAGRDIRRSAATMGAWGVEDQAAALDYMADRFPSAELWVIGHSLGGMCAPFHARADRIDRLIAVASGPAHWLKHPPGFIPLVFAFWWLIGPLATALLGYTPGKLLGLGADLPRGVYWQWRRWCLNQDFHRVDWGGRMPQPDLERMKGEVRLVSFADDVMIPPACVRELAKFYPAARVSHRTLDPAEIGAKAIGHLRVFAKRNSAAWPLLTAPA